jgi:hypothetical protein
MKYAAFFISIFFIASVNARTIYSFKQSSAIVSIINILSENAEDLKSSFRVSDKKYKVENTSQCEAASSTDALLAFKTAMDSVLRMFPDEEIPYDEALSDMNDFLDQQPLTLCKIVHRDERNTIATLYFFDKSDKIHLRIDNYLHPLALF